ncbi:cytochrome c oxidase assembly protein COX16 homolog, mitochondrial isoform X3 [Macaca fascicularis]|uniref:cytochrome c oxidase assembly protein COX16 homolog, mitochondrial isoform X3 n=1 Tax=Macaca fascicularis TaxID=9541 RepID=UPI001E2573B9|nr:cytochrome c oxidase assembly protein COX16 homolog, mitochondrial isoform X3 [Macaca fascicularis]XP_045252567.1 cytochrome c oxidase assembly protein COX16 homolog, mitochondrial isoform X3 [Macaca fascicularis]XP_045252568.1 cytochrome c oxidase assembly protein COX16 homolog, mitochondrial isoform X3 [Macaca fascicularis]
MEDFSHVCTRGDACFSQEQDSPLRSPHVGEWSEEDLPQGLLIVGGSFGLREFSQIRYDAVKIKMDPELEKKLKENKISLESEYEML